MPGTQTRGEEDYLRCQEATEKRKQNQWLLALTKYADRLIDDLGKVDFSPSLAQQQINWIGRSERARIQFAINNYQLSIGNYFKL